MMKSPEGAEVHLSVAYRWMCDCGEENFGVPLCREMTQEEAMAYYRAEAGLEDWEELPEGWDDFETMTLPTNVRCASCKCEFKTGYNQ